MSLPLPPACEGPRDFLLPTTSNKAVAGLVLGLLSFALGLLASVPAFVYAARALGEINRDPAHVRGRPLALAGIFAAGLGLFLQPLLLLLAVQALRDRVARQTNAYHLHEIGLAMHNYHATVNHFPPAAGQDRDGRPLLSWRVALLPYLGLDKLHAQFHTDEPWDSPHNAALVRWMPKVYAHPLDADGAADGLTYYRVFVGAGTPFDVAAGPGLAADFPNGNMFLVVEAASPVPWTKPEELFYDPDRPLPKLGGLLRGGCNVLFVDGSTPFLPDDVDERVLLPNIDGHRDGRAGQWWRR
jgi:prepilin-type processing-associated H-X9-DG protein